jgi:F-type H+-transporting ATPase subunit delta
MSTTETRFRGFSHVSSETEGDTGLAGRYATALFEMAEADQLLDAVADDLTALTAMLDESDDLRRLVRSPVVSRDDQAKAIQVVAEKAAFNDLTRKFLGLVAANRRLAALTGMIKAFQAQLADKRGETVAEVTSAQALNDSQVQAITEALRQATGTEVAVDAKVDPGLLGGLVVRVGSRMVDSSLSTKLSQLRTAMIGAG